jgi:hypothetical protein
MFALSARRLEDERPARFDEGFRGPAGVRPARGQAAVGFGPFFRHLTTTPVTMGRMPRKTKDRPGTVAGELSLLIESAEHSAAAVNRWERLWQAADVGLGWSAAVLAAVAGALGLGQVVGRTGAAIMALSTAGLIAGNYYLGSAARYEQNRRRRNAYQALAADARLAEAKANEQRLPDLDDVLHTLLLRQIAIKDMDHLAVPAEVLGR